MSNLIVNPEHPRVAVINDVRAIGAMRNHCELRIQSFCYWLADRRKMNPLGRLGDGTQIPGQVVHACRCGGSRQQLKATLTDPLAHQLSG
jgi:hypothetical protein